MPFARSNHVNGKIPLSVIIITRNEEKNIADCLGSVAWASEIIVVDSRSSDRTVEIARAFGANVFALDRPGYSAAKNLGLEKATQLWILWLDADERVTPELMEDIRGVCCTAVSPHGGYEMARRAYFLGRWIKHCGWYPGYIVRLFKREGARFNESSVHEKLLFSGTTGRLPHDLLHYTDNNLYHYFSKFNNYTSLAANDLHAQGREFRIYDQLVRPLFIFFKMYILKRGFLDGMHGLILSALSSAYVFMKYAKLWEKDNRWI